MDKLIEELAKLIPSDEEIRRMTHEEDMDD